ncbi:MAG: putative anti-sigma regulatory factor, serine/threonine protein kinase [Acidimicrobiales bacterium]|nr:putative anti-sigma regulatory factor, serine/threonine protein kinase [Acidimicrobiales bacterium]
MPLEVNLTLCLPRDTKTVPLVRHLIGAMLEEFGVMLECRGDVELAVTEACANVLDHSKVDDEYEVRVAVDPDRCQIRVIDTGHGFDFSTLSEESDPYSERGRGVQLMRALVDRIHFESEPEAGTIVHLVKDLHFAP